MHADRAPAMLQNPEGTKFADMHFEPCLPQAATKPGEHRYETTAGTAVATESPPACRDRDLADRLAVLRPVPAPDRVRGRRHAGCQRRRACLGGRDSLIILVTANALHFRLDPIQYGEEAGAPQLIPGALEPLSAIQTGASQVGMHNLWHMTVNPDGMISKFVTALITDPAACNSCALNCAMPCFRASCCTPMGKAVKGMRNLDSEAQELLQAVPSAQKNAGLLRRSGRRTIRPGTSQSPAPRRKRPPRSEKSGTRVPLFDNPRLKNILAMP